MQGGGVMDRRQNDLPVFKQISNILADEIQKDLKPGHLLPSETDLAKRFKVNRYTVRRATSELVTLGLLETLQGKGTIVKQRPINYSIHSTTRFTETLENAGRLAESLVLQKVGIPAEQDVAKMLEIEEGQPVILVETLRKMDGLPFALGSHFLPLDRVFEVMRSYHGGSLHEFLLQHYGIRLRRKISLISAIAPTQYDMDLLGIRGNHPLLRVKSVNIDQATGQSLELVVSRFKGISTQLSVEPVWTG
jgi:GntR family transcriptional regulator, phosphonate transport system regulatory protein